MKKQRGMTLIELMVVIVIIAILAGIAYPSYTRQVRETRRAECAGALMGLATAMERWFTERNRYDTATLAAMGYPAACPIDGSTPTTYNLAIDGTNTTQTTFRVTATPVGPQASDSCGTLSIDQVNRKLPNAACWN